MVSSEKPKNVTKAIIRETLDFTGLKGTFEEKIMLSYMVYNEKLLSLDILIIFETLDFTRI